MKLDCSRKDKSSYLTLSSLRIDLLTGFTHSVSLQRQKCKIAADYIMHLKQSGKRKQVSRLLTRTILRCSLKLHPDHNHSVHAQDCLSNNHHGLYTPCDIILPDIFTTM